MQAIRSICGAQKYLRVKYHSKKISSSGICQAIVIEGNCNDCVAGWDFVVVRELESRLIYILE